MTFMSCLDRKCTKSFMKRFSSLVKLLSLSETPNWISFPYHFFGFEPFGTVSYGIISLCPLSPWIQRFPFRLRNFSICLVVFGITNIFLQVISLALLECVCQYDDMRVHLYSVDQAPLQKSANKAKH